LKPIWAGCKCPLAIGAAFELQYLGQGRVRVRIRVRGILTVTQTLTVWASESVS
jgi:hypothetical protein